MIRVTLTEFELAFTTNVGTRRHIEALQKKLPDRHGYDGREGWQIHCEGACGELAVAKGLGRYWNGSFNTFKIGGDVGNLQVRTRRASHYDLIIRENDDPESYYMLVTGLAPVYDIIGYIKGSEGMSDAWKRNYADRPFAYFVPQGILTPVYQPKK